MPRKGESTGEPEPIRRRKASTPEAREHQLVNLAVDLAERQLIDGTASAQVITHYLKAGSTREYLERRKMELDMELIQAKRDLMESNASMEQKLDAAFEAMTRYRPGGDDEFPAGVEAFQP